MNRTEADLKRGAEIYKQAQEARKNKDYVLLALLYQERAHLLDKLGKQDPDLIKTGEVIKNLIAM